MWPAAWAVSNYLLSEPDLRDNLSSLSILELGTGTGLVSLATAMGGCKRVLATDYEPLALELTRYTADNINDNVCISEDSDCPLSERIETRILDLCALEEQPLPLTSEGDAKDFDIVVAADIMVCFTLTHVRAAYQGMSSGIHNPLPFEGQYSTSMIMSFHTGIINILLLEYDHVTSQHYLRDTWRRGRWEDSGCFSSLSQLENTSL